MIPRVVIAGTASGAGKTSVACGVIGALCRRGLRVQGFKVGPDYIDPTYHALASGRPGRNLDAFLNGAEMIGPLLRHGMEGADVAVVEGVMGLFDGVSGRGELASTAHVSKLLRAPVVLVLDAASMARSAAAILHGYRTFDPDVDVAGVIFNKVGSDRHEELLREAVAPMGVRVLGTLRRDARLAAPERHLGLVPAVERTARTRASLDALAVACADRLDLDGLLALARSVPSLEGEAWSPAQPSEQCATDLRSLAQNVGSGARIAIARGPAFSFHYRENIELLEATGCELLPFDPLVEETLPPDAGALLLAGGFPEVYGSELAANAPMRAQVAAFAASGRPVLAECGGLLYLCTELDGHAMCGVLPARASMTDRLKLGYREGVAATATPWLDEGERVRGHEFHYTHVEPLDGERTRAAWTLSAPATTKATATTPATTTTQRDEGIVVGALQASYLHVHWAAHPRLAARFAHAARLAHPAAV
jgi:cobyrinic acid a,c-diamide synthase